MRIMMSHIKSIWIDFYYSLYRFFEWFAVEMGCIAAYPLFKYIIPSLYKHSDYKTVRQEIYRLYRRPDSTICALIDKAVMLLTMATIALAGNIACIIADNYSLLSIYWFLSIAVFTFFATYFVSWTNERYLKEFQKRDKLSKSQKRKMFLMSTFIIIAIIVSTCFSFLEVIDRLNELKH